MIRKVVVIGPESTGKSTLCEQLAAHYQTAWVKEFAREYLLTHGSKYAYADLGKIAEGQLHLEDEICKAAIRNQQSALMFIDTDMYVMKVWSEFVFNKCDSSILNEIVKRHYDLYLLCNTDLPWVADELREYPDLHSREVLFHYYKDAMINQPVPWVEITGNNEQRLAKAISAINKMMF
ncbi:MAG: ATP-binding protein [Bacteroidetes bacterium]|nr:ATP-binding protein [Bacteroidota bacterium]